MFWLLRLFPTFAPSLPDCSHRAESSHEEGTGLALGAAAAEPRGTGTSLRGGARGESRTMGSGACKTAFHNSESVCDGGRSLCAESKGCEDAANERPAFWRPRCAWDKEPTWDGQLNQRWVGSRDHQGNRGGAQSAPSPAPAVPVDVAGEDVNFSPSAWTQNDKTVLGWLQSDLWISGSQRDLPMGRNRISLAVRTASGATRGTISLFVAVRSSSWGLYREGGGCSYVELHPTGDCPC